MQFRVMSIMIVLLCSALAIAGCTGTQTPPVPTTPGSGPGATAGTGSPSLTLTTEPTNVVPEYNLVVVDVGVKDYLGNIEVIYQGGMGQIHVKKITTKITRADGKTQTVLLENKKGSTVELEGTKQTDRVEVWVSMDNGQTYKINDVLRDYRIH
jgi:PBP1b-binding outer membrane lipoprotein LpoB